MILKGVLSFDKRSLPKYIYRFNVALVTFFAASITGYIAAGVAIGVVLGDNAEMYFTFSYLTAFILGTLIFYVVGLRLRERLVCERTAEIEREFADMPLEKATAELIERGIITESGFVANENDCIFGDTVIPFSKLEFFVGAQLFVFKKGNVVQVWTRPSHIDVFLNVRSAENEVVEFEEEYAFDGALFNFIDKRGFITNYERNPTFALLKNDKKNFCRVALGFKMK